MEFPGKAGGMDPEFDIKDVCPVIEVIDRISGKWSISVLVATAHGPVRFTELERQITGISRRMLTLTLRNLERDGLLTRTVYPTVPPRVEYAATGMARELYEHLAGFTSWAARHQGEIAAARTAYDAGRTAEPVPAPG
ncbi:transcriptional regulator [Actinomadura craniellae]|uniref:Transcriptional regulator n=1 Tax=Actinomadura craniellae TaxID=2231787 RepID=A0A365HGV0_9ACTN|nr:helix-turn-helix domain-containing protein [Actinomadura craniellae]RAY17263.1 transcriptional regulator [Actinomadura craniellae]